MELTEKKLRREKQFFKETKEIELDFDDIPDDIFKTFVEYTVDNMSVFANRDGKGFSVFHDWIDRHIEFSLLDTLTTLIKYEYSDDMATTLLEWKKTLQTALALVNEATEKLSDQEGA